LKGREHGCIVVKRWWSVPSTIIGNPRCYDGYPYACSVSTSYVMKGRADLPQRNLFEATQTGGRECSRHRSWDRTKAPQTVVSADGKGSQRTSIKASSGVCRKQSSAACESGSSVQPTDLVTVAVLLATSSLMILKFVPDAPDIML